MCFVSTYRTNFTAVDKGNKFHLALGDNSNEVANQKNREADKFSYYSRDNQIPSNPLKELDELYSKDERVLQTDLEIYARETIKKQEADMFNKEMAQLNTELEQLNEGKFTALTACPSLCCCSQSQHSLLA